MGLQPLFVLKYFKHEMEKRSQPMLSKEGTRLIQRYLDAVKEQAQDSGK
jgi:hypothetical protein